MNNSELPPYDAFINKLRKINPVEKDHSDYEKLFSCGSKTEKALSKMELSKPSPSGEETYQYLLDIWNQEIMCTLKTFYAGTTTKTLPQHWKQCKKCLFFITRKELTF